MSKEKMNVDQSINDDNSNDFAEVISEETQFDDVETEILNEDENTNSEDDSIIDETEEEFTSEDNKQDSFEGEVAPNEQLEVVKTDEEILEELKAKLIETDNKYLMLQADYQNKKKKSDEINSKAKQNGINETFAKMQKPLTKLTKLKTSDEEFKKGIDMILTNTQMRFEVIGLSMDPGGKNE